MADMLVKLYELPDVTNLIAQQQAAGIDIRRAIAPEKHVVVNWVRETFQQYWANECDVCFANQPVSCFVAVAEARPIGFACYDATFKNFLAPQACWNPIVAMVSDKYSCWLRCMPWLPRAMPMPLLVT